jgi:type IV secretion system protein VirB11
MSPDAPPSITTEDRAKQAIERALGPELLAVLHDPKTIELILNPDGSLWVECLGEPMRPIGTMAGAKAQSILENVAGFHRKEVKRTSPLLECELPIDGSRFAAQLPPIVPAASFQIRKKAIKVFTLDDYVARGIMTDAQFMAIVKAVRERRNIIVSGGTGSGKTTLANAIIGEITDAFPDDRLIIIEDTGEIQCRAANYAQWHTTIDVNMRDLIKHALRARPDRIIVGETRGPDAMDLLSAWNTGHEGGLATVHANNPRAALSRLQLLISMHPESPRPMEPLIGEAVHVIVHIARLSDGSRHVQGILEVDGFRAGAFVTSPL